jgi:hypothetical protein
MVVGECHAPDHESMGSPLRKVHASAFSFLKRKGMIPKANGA